MKVVLMGWLKLQEWTMQEGTMTEWIKGAELSSQSSNRWI